MKAEPIRYKETLAMPGSQLHKILFEKKENWEQIAALMYKEVNQRYHDLLKKN